MQLDTSPSIDQAIDCCLWNVVPLFNAVRSCWILDLYTILWKLKMSQFFHGLHTHQTCHPLRMFGMLWVDIYDRVFQFPLISSNFAQHWRVGQHSTGHNQQPDQLYAKEMCCAAWGKWWSHQILTGFLIHASTFSFWYLWPTDVCMYVYVFPALWNP